MLGYAFDGDVGSGSPEVRNNISDGHADVGALGPSAPQSDEQAFRLPWVDAFVVELLGMIGGIRCQRHRAIGGDADDLMMAVLSSRSDGHGVVVGDDDVRLQLANHKNESRGDGILSSPRVEGFPVVFGVSEVPEIQIMDLRAVVPSGGLGLGGTNGAEIGIEFRSDFILPAFP